MAGHFGEAAIALGYLFHVVFEGIDRAQLAFSPCQGAGLMGITTRRPSSAKAVDTLSLSTVASLVSPTLNQVNWIRGNPHPPSPPVPYLEVRDRETPVLSGLVRYVRVCDSMPRGRTGGSVNR
jgi:hypothetical protein